MANVFGKSEILGNQKLISLQNVTTFCLLSFSFFLLEEEEEKSERTAAAGHLPRNQKIKRRPNRSSRSHCSLWPQSVFSKQAKNYSWKKNSLIHSYGSKGIISYVPQKWLSGEQSYIHTSGLSRNGTLNKSGKFAVQSDRFTI